MGHLNIDTIAFLSMFTLGQINQGGGVKQKTSGERRTDFDGVLYTKLTYACPSNLADYLLPLFFHILAFVILIERESDARMISPHPSTSPHHVKN